MREFFSNRGKVIPTHQNNLEYIKTKGSVVIVNCPYCATPIQVDNNGVVQEICEFCGGHMREQQTGMLQICQNGERFEFTKMQQNIFLEHINQSVGELKQYHTYDLYLLLKEVREARSQTYYGLQLLNKASKTEGKLQVTANETGGEYEYYTRKAWVIENILLERQGFFPEKITARVLQYMEEQIKKSKKKTMKISKVQRQHRREA
ncbi:MULTISPECIES: hypothetical protein [Bacillus cereus group]|uniref:TFIIB-type zinc ribbon-containing protein n=1 Tax=Bacillus cereus TIAC219 TaxID=718222 RepID=A0ABC9SPP7_BACCE|nr:MULTISPECIES: hypothetical protein [Bacillus cereus group]EJP82335.1 hypothetical protein IC1_05983 [Bacillus cereus VD022]EOQ57434.1 hypothetical protein IAY_06453 [Bacillus cereus TIAC219]